VEGEVGLPMSAPALKTSMPSPIPADVVIANRQASVGLSTAMNFDRFIACGAMYASWRNRGAKDRGIPRRLRACSQSRTRKGEL